MKKILFSILLFIASFASFAQIKLSDAIKIDRAELGGKQTNVTDSTCFCCGDFYNLPTPTIKGPDEINCNGKNTFSIPACPTNATYTWTVSPAASFNGQGTNSITINPPFSTGAYTICVTITCGKNKVSNCKTVKASCCDCSKLSQKPVIKGPSCFCLGTNCDEILTYSVPSYGEAPCFTYQWNIQSSEAAIKFTGQGTNQIKFNCSTLKAGNYTITLTIKCGATSVTSTFLLVVCKKPDPSFSMSSDGNTVTFSSTVGCTNLWYFFEDKNSDCLHDAGDGGVLGQSGSTATFNVVDGKQYVIHHYVQCTCGNGCVCQSFKPMCFKWLPSQQQRSGKGVKGVEIISEKTSENMKDIPAAIKREIEKTTGAKID